LNKLILLLVFLGLNLNVFAQEVKIKKDVVYVDGVESLNVGGDMNNVSFYDLEGNEIIFMRYIHDSKYGSLYTKTTFLDINKSFTNMTYIFTKKDLIKKLIENKVLVNGKIDPEKAERFITKYDEQVEKESLIIEIKQ
jgi:hypothetical protein